MHFSFVDMHRQWSDNVKLCHAIHIHCQFPFLSCMWESVGGKLKCQNNIVSRKRQEGMVTSCGSSSILNPQSSFFIPTGSAAQLTFIQIQRFHHFLSQVKKQNWFHPHLLASLWLPIYKFKIFRISAQWKESDDMAGRHLQKKWNDFHLIYTLNSHAYCPRLSSSYAVLSRESDQPTLCARGWNLIMKPMSR